MEAVAIKVLIDQSMIGKPAYVLTDAEKYQVSEWGEYIAVKFNPGVDQRSLEQNNTYWACIALIVEHAADDIEWNTKEKVHTQIRWAVKFINKESAVHLTRKGGESRLYFELKSISFSKANRKEANNYFNDAFEYMAALLNITVDELVAEAQSRMKKRRICKLCGKSQKIQGHHKLSQTEHYRKIYPEYIDHPDNKIDYCIDCHDNKSIEKWTEAEFCKHFGIEIRSKSG